MDYKLTKGMVILLRQLKGLRLDRFVVAREDIARDGTTVKKGV